MSLTTERKKLIGVITIIATMSSLVGVIYLRAATLEYIYGEFDIVNQSRMPVIVDWFDPEILIPHMADAQFYCEIYDYDNDSTELIVTLFYSNDHWELQNGSITMTFSHSPSSKHYYYTYLWAGEPEGTYYQYYYQVNDGNVTVKKPAEHDVFFDIQWDVQVNIHDYVPVYLFPLLADPCSIFLIILSIILIIIIVSLLISKRRNSRYNRKR